MLQDAIGIELSALKPQLLLPYLSVEVLSEDPLMLLALIHHRSTARISDWAIFDGMQIRSSFSQGVLEANYNPHCVTMYVSVSISLDIPSTQLLITVTGVEKTMMLESWFSGIKTKHIGFRS